MPLTVLSALARREIDAWEFAARLDVESVQTQVREMSALIAALPSGMPPLEPPDLIVRRLLALLPGERRMARPAGAAAADAGMHAEAPVGSLELIIGGVFFVLLSFWVIGGLFESATTARTVATTARTVATSATTATTATTVATSTTPATTVATSATRSAAPATPAAPVTAMSAANPISGLVPEAVAVAP